MCQQTSGNSSQTCYWIYELGPWTLVHFLTPVNSGRVDGCQKMHPSWRAVKSARELGPWTRVVETGLNLQYHFEINRSHVKVIGSDKSHTWNASQAHSWRTNGCTIFKLNTLPNIITICWKLTQLKGQRSSSQSPVIYWWRCVLQNESQCCFMVSPCMAM